MVETLGFQGIAINVWLVWILPFVGAAIIAGVARLGSRQRDYTAVGFALASAISDATLIQSALSGNEIHSQVIWISVVNVKAGILGDLCLLFTFVAADDLPLVLLGTRRFN